RHAVVEIVAAAVEDHVPHLERIIHAFDIRIGQRQQLGIRLNRDVEMAPGEAAGQIIVITAQVVAPLKRMTGRLRGPEIISAGDECDDYKNGAMREPHPSDYQPATRYHRIHAIDRGSVAASLNS